MKLSEIKEGVVVRCPNCDCGQTVDGYVEGKIYLVSFDLCPNECLDANHKGSPHRFALQVCPMCSTGVKRKHWMWADGVAGSKIEVVG